ncbi:MAG: hypothetical protein GY948_12245 [Alphaproteobacteria bacterium]|nr:hypothetical protein [Alphaproteobacteria bacterium]
MGPWPLHQAHCRLDTRCVEHRRRHCGRRAESRGAHFRSDFPECSDANWRGNIAATLRGGNLSFRYDPIV